MMMLCLIEIFWTLFCVAESIAMLLNNTFEEIVLINCDLMNYKKTNLDFFYKFFIFILHHLKKGRFIDHIYSSASALGTE